MTISDAIPIQFWDIDEDTFNESQPICGLTPDCFCLPVNCSQPVPIQFTDTVQRDYRITFYDQSDSEIIELSFDSQQVGDLWVYSLTITPEDDLGICNAKIYGKISYYENTVSGSVTDVIESVDGDITTVTVNSRVVIFLLDPEVCDGEDTTVYYSGAFGPGTVLYTNAALTILATGHTYVSDAYDTTNVYFIDSVEADVGADTGFDCAG